MKSTSCTPIDAASGKDDSSQLPGEGGPIIPDPMVLLRAISITKKIVEKPLILTPEQRTFIARHAYTALMSIQLTVKTQQALVELFTGGLVEKVC